MGEKLESCSVDIFEGLEEGIPFNMKASLLKFEIWAIKKRTYKRSKTIRMTEINNFVLQ